MAGDLKVLWPTDGSDAALTATALLRQLVLPVSASVHVLCVASESAGTGLDLSSGLTEEEDHALQRARLTAEESANRLASASVPVEVVTRAGHPVQEIVRFAEQGDFDLIVLGAKGHSDLDLMVLGSVAQGVIDYATVSTLIIRPGTASFDTAVVGIDGSEESLRALRFMEKLSLPPSARLVLCRVIRLITQRSPSAGADEAFNLGALQVNEANRERARRDLAQAHDLLSWPVAGNEMPAGESGQQLLVTAAQWNAQLIVVGSRKRSEHERLQVGSTAEMVVREALCSVLVVR